MIDILDSTLRDGAQAEGISFTIEDKLKIVSALDRLGAAYIEAGNPASNPKDLELFRRLREKSWERAKIAAFGATRRPGLPAGEDAQVAVLLSSGAPATVIFGKSWDFHVTEVIKTSLSENLAMIRETIDFLKERGREVIFDAEHFFDGYKANRDYALETLRAAAGASCVCLCDTNGGAFFDEIGEITRVVASRFPGMKIGAHCHNDGGMAVAGSVAAVFSGAEHVQGTLTGFGERCGNADLAAIIANLQLKRGYTCIPPENMELLTETARLIGEIAGGSLRGNAPYVGRSAFAHKAGMHIDGVKKASAAFEHVEPSSVGNERRFLISEVSGRGAVLPEIRKIAPEITKDSPETEAVLRELKRLENKGWQFEAAEGSVALIIRKLLGRYRQFFELVDYDVIVISGRCARAMIKIKVGESEKITAAEGDGPVDALNKALRKALSGFYPELKSVRLTDYKVRLLSVRAKFPTASVVRVLIESSDGNRSWSTVGVASDIIHASWAALTDSIEYKLNEG
ncbi:MAG: citramalate synthase [Clostridiales bacterium]|jgi:2-isopropylmalate synthase|nr:citramalate synthase [Clostridiales bacterium]